MGARMLLMPAAGGDLYSAIQADTDNRLLWYGLGHRIALDIARGLYFLHSHEVAGSQALCALRGRLLSCSGCADEI